MSGGEGVLPGLNGLGDDRNIGIKTRWDVRGIKIIITDTGMMRELPIVGAGGGLPGW
jgi:hypothetical protein